MTKRNIRSAIDCHLCGSLASIWTQRIPDAKTIWLFRETLAQAGVVEALFKQFDAYLADQGLQPRGGQLIDASLVPVPKQRNTREENAAIKAGQSPTEWEADPAKRRQKDIDARWTVKHGDNHYGYKNHVNVDKQHKLIRRYTVTNAAVHDSQALEAVLQPVCRRARRVGGFSVSLPGDGSVTQEAAPPFSHSRKRLSGQASDSAAKRAESASSADTSSRRTCLRPPSDGDGREAHSNDWGDPGSSKDRAQKSGL